MKLSSNSIIKHGMPFVGLSLRRALCYVDQMIITISAKADERTIQEIMKLRDPKIEIYWEDVKHMSELTRVENDQLKKSTGDWIWTLEDDELWLDEDLRGVMSHFDEDIEGIAVNPFQVIDREHYEYSFRKKYLTKFFKREGAEWRHPFPKNMPYRNGHMLNRHRNKDTKMVKYKYFHLPLVKEHSLRDELDDKYKYSTNNPVKMPDKYIKGLKDIVGKTW